MTAGLMDSALSKIWRVKRGQGKISKLGQPENVAEWKIQCEYIKVVSGTVK
jgi:hypothetical protein